MAREKRWPLYARAIFGLFAILLAWVALIFVLRAALIWAI